MQMSHFVYSFAVHPGLPPPFGSGRYRCSERECARIGLNVCFPCFWVDGYPAVELLEHIVLLVNFFYFFFFEESPCHFPQLFPFPFPSATHMDFSFSASSPALVPGVFNRSHPPGGRWYLLRVVLICIFTVTSEAEHLFPCLWAIRMSLEKCLSKPFIRFLTVLCC